MANIDDEMEMPGCFLCVLGECTASWSWLSELSAPKDGPCPAVFWSRPCSNAHAAPRVQCVWPTTTPWTTPWPRRWPRRFQRHHLHMRPAFISTDKGHRLVAR